MQTIFGFEWPVASGFDIALMIGLAALVVAFASLLRYYQYLKDKERHEEQFFNFKTKQLGLTNFQYKILLGIVRIVGLKDYRAVLHTPSLFESSIASFMSYIHKKDESVDSLLAIGKDIVITYEKLYHPAAFRKPLDSIRDLETDSLMYFQTEDDRVFVGKLTAKDQSSLALTLYRELKEGELLQEKVSVFVWRNGDAEYTFEATVSESDGNGVRILIPDVFKRGREVRHPYLEVMIPCTLSWPVDREKGGGAEETDSVRGTICKMNEHEIVVRVGSPIAFEREYSIDFTLSDFKIRSPLKTMADAVIHEENMHYYTFKFLEISEIAADIIRKYIVERID